jgi:hypothetical protein
MIHEYEERLKLHFHKDQRGVVRDLLHVEEPFASRARTPQLAAREYWRSSVRSSASSPTSCFTSAWRRNAGR